MDSYDSRLGRWDWESIIKRCSLKWPGKALTTKLVKAVEGSPIRMLGVNQDLKWHADAGGLVIEIPKEFQDEAKRPCRQAYAFKIESQPWETFSELPPDAPPSRSTGKIAK